MPVAAARLPGSVARNERAIGTADVASTFVR
jgi:hypothetical protein